MPSTSSIPLFRPIVWRPVRRAYAVPTYDGLTAFAPCWGMAALFSIAGDPRGLAGSEGLVYLLLAWGVVVASTCALLFPRKTWTLIAIATVTVMLYYVRLPVASNNKTITVVFDLSLLTAAAVLYSQNRLDRVSLYETLRMPARLLLAIMYFYGIFHKINTDFLDPDVSCAVGLYKPLAAPFGLQDNLAGRYLAIGSTFVAEGIAIVSLFWRKWFAVGLIVALVFHYVIPISAFSWYMDFSSLVFALYMLSMPREVSAQIYAIAYKGLVAPLRDHFGRMGIFAPLALLLGMATVVILLLSLSYPGRPALMLLHSIFILLWSVVGGIAMTVMIYAALHHLPFKGAAPVRSERWTWIIPGLFFLSCLSPYVGLKTESSISMFSNLHTEGGTTNHLLFAKPPYLFHYQDEVVKVVASSSPALQATGEAGRMNVLYTVEQFLRRNPNQWVSYIQDGKLVDHATAAGLPAQQTPALAQRFLIFKEVDPSRPKVCTH